MDVDRSLDEIIEEQKREKRERRSSTRTSEKESIRKDRKDRVTRKSSFDKPYQNGGKTMTKQQGNVAARVYVHNLPYSHTWRDLKDHFAQAGEVVRADIMMTRTTGRSRGCGLVEFSTAEDAQNAIATLNDTEIDGRRILVREDREKGDKPVSNNNIARIKSVQADSFNPQQGRQVFVNNLDKSITWQELKDAFAPAGEVERADIIGDGRLSKGQGLILFKTAEAAQKAIEDFHEGELKNKTISVKMDEKVGQYVRPQGAASQAAVVSAKPPREPRAPVAASKRVYVHNLPYQVQSEDLKRHFEVDGGVVIGAEVMRLITGRSKGCGIVEFETIAMATHAIQTLNNSPLDGRNILVREDRQGARKQEDQAE